MIIGNGVKCIALCAAILLAATIGGCHAKGGTAAEEKRILRQIVADLGLSKIPDVGQANISLDEYQTKLAIYRQSVAQTEAVKQLQEHFEEHIANPLPLTTSIRPMFAKAARRVFDQLPHGRAKRALNEEANDEDNLKVVHESKDMKKIHLDFDLATLLEGEADPKEATTMASKTKMLVSSAYLTFGIKETSVNRPTCRLGALQVVDGQEGIQLDSIRVNMDDLRDGEEDSARSIQLDVSHAVQAWLINPNTNKGLILTVSNDDEKENADAEGLNSCSHIVQLDLAKNIAISVNSLTGEAHRTASSSNGFGRGSAQLLDLIDGLNYANNQEDSVEEEEEDEDNDDDFALDFDVEISSTAGVKPKATAAITGSNWHFFANLPAPTSQLHRRLRRSLFLSTEMPQARKGKTDCSKASNNKGKGGGRKCCRQHMRVNLRELEGFDFIMQPAEFDAFYCRGKCPARHNPLNDHSLIQSLMHLKSRDAREDGGNAKKIKRPCCSPSKFESIDILHLDEMDNQKLKVTHWKDIIVSECACS